MQRTGKRIVVEPNTGDRGDNKYGGSVVERIVRKLTGGLVSRTLDNQTSRSNYPKVLEPDYCKARLLEIGVGRRFWQSNPSAENARTFYVQWSNRCDDSSVEVSWKHLQEITATDDRTPIALEINPPGGFYQGKQTAGTPLMTPHFNYAPLRACISRNALSSPSASTM